VSHYVSKTCASCGKKFISLADISLSTCPSCASNHIPFVEPPSLHEVKRAARRRALGSKGTPEDFELLELVRDLLANK